MPRISEFAGLSIYLYFADNLRHSAPHFHAMYGEFEAVLSIPDGEVLDGYLPAKKLRLAQAWAILRTEELERAWALAVNKQPVPKIEPLK